MAQLADRAECERKAREIFVERLQRLLPGQAIQKEELLQQHPKLAAELRAVFAEHERLRAILDSPHPPEPDITPDNGGATVDMPGKPEERRSAERIVIDKYEVMTRIGRGGQAEVFQAFDPAIPGRTVAIKWFLEELSPEEQRGWMNDLVAATKIDDPGMVRLYGAGVWKQRPYLVYEFVEGVGPKVAVEQSRTPMRKAAAILAEAAGIVARLHRQGVQHADLKPGNLLIDSRDRVRILDFGLARWSRVGAPSVEWSSGPFGTPQYMAPEVARGDPGPLDHRTDVFGLGAVGYALVTGHPPYDRKKIVEALDLARRADCPPARHVQPRVPRRLDRILRKAMHADPAQRYQTATDLERALRWYLWSSSRWTLALSAAVLLVALAAAVWVAARNGPAPVTVHPPEIAAGPGVGTGQTLAEPGESAAATESRTPSPESIPPAAPVSSDRVLTISVSNKSPDKPKTRVVIGEPGAVPVRNGDMVHLQVELEAPAYLYLLWIGSDGKCQRLHPAAGVEASLLRELRIPEALNQGLPIDGPPGVETAVMIAAHQPLDRAFWDSLPGPVSAPAPAPARFEPHEVYTVEWESSSGRLAIRSSSRGVGAEPQTIDDPLLELIETLRPHAARVKALRFAHVE